MIETLPCGTAVSASFDDHTVRIAQWNLRASIRRTLMR